MRFGDVAVAAGLMLGVAGCGPKRAAMPAPSVSASAPKPRAKSQPEARSEPALKPKPKPKPKPTPPAPAAAAKPSRPSKPTVAKPSKPAVAKKPVPVDSARLEAALILERSHAPLSYVLSRRSGNKLIADRAAAAVVYEARRLRLSPSLVAAVLLVENTPMDSTARSVAGAVGLMQVMPVHSGGLGCPSDELQEVEANICHGARVLHMYLRRSRTVQIALRRYNGCIGARVTRRCLRYPARVLRTASLIRREMLRAPVDTTPPAPPVTAPATQAPYYLRRASVTPDSTRPQAPAGAMLSILFSFLADTVDADEE